MDKRDSASFSAFFKRMKRSPRTVVQEIMPEDKPNRINAPAAMR